MHDDAQPGRDAQGRWLRNDATAQQSTEAVVELLEMIVANIWWHVDERARADALLEIAKGAGALMDAGERPASKETADVLPG